MKPSNMSTTDFLALNSAMPKPELRVQGWCDAPGNKGWREIKDVDIRNCALAEANKTIAAMGVRPTLGDQLFLGDIHVEENGQKFVFKVKVDAVNPW